MNSFATTESEERTVLKDGARIMAPTRRHRFVWGILLAVVTAALLRVVFFIGYTGGDDWRYFVNAVEIGQGRATPNGSHWQARIAVTLPGAALYAVGAPSWAVTAGAPMAWSLLSVIIAGVAGRVFAKDPRVGVTAAFLVAVFPLDILYASCMYPAMGIAATTGLAGLLYFVGIERDRTSLLFASGVLLGVAYLHRITALYIVLPMLVWLLWERKWRWRYLAVAAGLLLVVGIEVAVFQWWFDDPWHRFHVLTGRSMTKQAGPSVPIRPGGPFFSPIVSLLTNQEFGLFYYVAPFPVVAVVQRLRCRSQSRNDRLPRGLIFCLLWFVLVLGYTLWGSTSPIQYRPLRPWPRYFSHVTLPLVVLVAWWLASVVRPRTRQWTLSLLIATSLAGVWLDGSRSYPVLAQDLLRKRNEFRDAPCYVSRSAYVMMFYANNCDPLHDVSVVANNNGKDRYTVWMRKIQPDVEIHRRWEDVGSGLAVVRRQDCRFVPGSWQHRGNIAMPTPMFLFILRQLGGFWSETADRIAGKHLFSVFEVSSRNLCESDSLQKSLLCSVE